MNAEREQTNPMLIGKRQLAALLNIGLSTIERYHSIGWVPRGVRIGNALRWRLDEIREWVADGCPRPSKCPPR